MKYLIFIFLLIICISVNAQTINQLTPTEFENISINGHAIKAIRATNGAQSAVQNLFGTAQSIKNPGEVDGIISRTYYYNGLELGFSSQVVTKGHFSGLRITNSAPTITIKGTTIKIGDNITKLGLVKRNDMTTGGKSVVFSPEDDETVYLAIEFDPATNVITKISYFVLT